MCNTYAENKQGNILYVSLRIISTKQKIRINGRNLLCQSFSTNFILHNMREKMIYLYLHYVPVKEAYEDKYNSEMSAW